MLSREDRLEQGTTWLLNLFKRHKAPEGSAKENGVISLVDPTSTLIPTKEAASTHVCGCATEGKRKRSSQSHVHIYKWQLWPSPLTDTRYINCNWLYNQISPWAALSFSFSLILH